MSSYSNVILCSSSSLSSHVTRIIQWTFLASCVKYVEGVEARERKIKKDVGQNCDCGGRKHFWNGLQNDYSVDTRINVWCGQHEKKHTHTHTYTQTHKGYIRYAERKTCYSYHFDWVSKNISRLLSVITITLMDSAMGHDRFANRGWSIRGVRVD